MKIRTERPDDIAAIRALHIAAFETEAEATLVDALRADGDGVLSLVAVDDSQSGAVIGHVMFSRLNAPLPSLALAPVAVSLSRRGQGVAQALIHQGIAQARVIEEAAIFVLGDPDYYTRFGFTVAAASGFECVYSGPYLMALMLEETTVSSGALTYPPAFVAV